MPPPDRARPPARATLEIVGVPGAVVSVFTETAWDAASLPIFEGSIPASGQLRLRVPRMPLRVVASVFGVAPVRFAEADDLVRVSLLPAAPDTRGPG